MTSPTPGADREQPKRADLLLPWEIVVAPARAFERIAVLPEWMVAYGVSVVLMLCTATMSYPALLHVQGIADRAMHQTPIDAHTFFGDLLLTSGIEPLVKIMMYAIAIAVFAITRDAKNLTKYPQFVSLTANATVIWSLGQIVEAIAIRLRNPNSFADFRSLDMSLPLRLTFIADKTNLNQVSFLSNFGVFETWTSIVLAFGFSRLANVGLVPALVFIFALDLTFALVTI